ncbi:DEAD/DEAH box helicase [Kocuria sp.]|uniref:DEAD/DEAH box helicase n=1 Tax=Kocuria sp. TaxID=1871328 RepID=UPI0026DFB0BD|nr:DEAD/DEAH box helicase [Kocuria sp.]MDO5617170.1 DEAD/DEAH box helicase [Kocuria sp.]
MTENPTREQSTETEPSVTSTNSQNTDSIEAVAEASLEATPQAVAEAPTSFADFGVRQDIVEALAAEGITSPFPIQAMTLPVALTGQDIIGQAKTGTGKTLGFGIPVIQRVVGRDDDGWGSLKHAGAPQALIIVPTRELAVQVGSDLATAAKTRNARVLTIYGGRAYEPQIEALERGAEIVVGTPGRLIDLNRQHHLDLSQVKAVVLDEADEMLDLGFLPDVEKILSTVPKVRHTMLFSATMPGPVVAMARRYMSKPMHIRAAAPDEGTTKADIRQVIYRAHALDKDEVVSRILQAEGRGKTIIFTRTKRTAAKVADELSKRGFAAAPLHGDLGQGAREQALRAFRNNKVDVLVATDVAARGIDVDDVTHVINYQCPEDEKTFLHRTGRTGRAGNKGTAITFVDWDDVPRWRLIDKALELGVQEPQETYSSSAHLYTDLNIPEGTKGRLPKNKRTHAGLGAETLEDLGGPDSSSRKSSGRGSTGQGRGASGRNKQGASGGGESRTDSDRESTRGTGRNRRRSNGRAGQGRRGGQGNTGGPGNGAETSQRDGRPHDHERKQDSGAAGEGTRQAGERHTTQTRDRSAEGAARRRRRRRRTTNGEVSGNGNTGESPQG